MTKSSGRGFFFIPMLTAIIEIGKTFPRPHPFSVSVEYVVDDSPGLGQHRDVHCFHYF